MPQIIPVEHVIQSVNIVANVQTPIVHNQNMVVRTVETREANGTPIEGFIYMPDPNDPTNAGYLEAVNDNYPNTFIWLFGVQQLTPSTITATR